MYGEEEYGYNGADKLPTMKDFEAHYPETPLDEVEFVLPEREHSMTHYGVATDYEYNATHKRDRLTIWSGPFYGIFEGKALSMVARAGYVVTTYGGDKLLVMCQSPRTDENFAEVDEAINRALNLHYAKLREWEHEPQEDHED